jgi:hypothetical protein
MVLAPWPISVDPIIPLKRPGHHTEFLNNSAALYDDRQGRFNIAERLYVECVATRQRTRSTHHLAVLCGNEGDRAKADSLLRLCLEQRSTHYEVFNISITLQGQKILDHFE